MMSHNGTVGHAVRKIQEFGYPWMNGLWSSCIRTAWPPSGSLIVTKAWLISTLGWLPPRFIAISERTRDDVTVVVVRETSGGR